MLPRFSSKIHHAETYGHRDRVRDERRRNADEDTRIDVPHSSHDHDHIYHDASTRTHYVMIRLSIGDFFKELYL